MDFKRNLAGCVLQPGTVVPLRLGLASESRVALTQHTPVLLKDAEVGRVVPLVIAYTRNSVFEF
jgi:hypothetical protein